MFKEPREGKEGSAHVAERCRQWWNWSCGFMSLCARQIQPQLATVSGPSLKCFSVSGSAVAARSMWTLRRSAAGRFVSHGYETWLRETGSQSRM